jgi:hypothetical protein
MRIPLNDVATAAECFRYYNFLKESHKIHVPKLWEIAEYCAKRGYLSEMRSGFKSEWRQIVGWVDKAVFKSVDIEDEESYKQGRKDAETILKFLREWYLKTYRKEDYPSYMDITLSHEFTRSCVFAAIPIIKVEDKHPTIMVFSDVATNVRQLYNSIRYRGLQWLVSKELNCSTVALEHYYFGPQGALVKTKMFAREKENKRTEETIRQVSSLITLGADWPSVTEQCNLCAFNGRCKL